MEPSSPNKRTWSALQELRTVEALLDVEQEWWELWRETGRSPFQSPAWLIPWAEEFTGGNLLVLAVRDNERLAVLAPFYLWEGRMFLLGNGISDYLDICALPSALDVTSGWLHGRACEFNQVPGDSLLRRMLPAMQEADPCLELQLPLPANHKELKEARYFLRRARKEGDLAIERAQPENVEEFMRELFLLHESRWKERGEPGVLADVVVQRFHRAASVRLARAGLLRLHRLKLNGATIAIIHAFANARQTCFYLSGFDPAFAKLSPGTLLLAHVIEQASSSGQKTFNFLRGSEPYKFAWGATAVPTFGFQGLA